MKSPALDLLASARMVAAWRSLGFARDELQTWQGGILPGPMSVARWRQVFPAHVAQVQAEIDE